MSKISIIKLGEGKASPIPIKEEKLTIGRGPFLQITDKRVSRNHAVLEASGGKLYLTPTHTNPCFFKKTVGSSVEIMKKDEKRLLENGHVFGLLPDSLYFKVLYDAVQNGTAKSKKVAGKKKTGEDDDDDDDESEDDSEDESEDSEDEVDEKPVKPKSGFVRPQGKDMAMPLDKKRKLPAWMVQMAKTPAVVSKPKTPTKPKVAKSPPKKKPVAKRKKAESEEDEDFDIEEEEEVVKSTSKRGRAVTQKKYKDESDDDWIDDEEDYKPKKTSRSKGRAQTTPKKTPKPKPRRRARPSSDEEDWDDEDEVPAKKSKRRRGKDSEDEQPGTSRRMRAARGKRTSYVDDFVDMSDDGFDDEDEDDKFNQSKDSDFVMDEADNSHYLIS